MVLSCLWTTNTFLYFVQNGATSPAGRATTLLSLLFKVPAGLRPLLKSRSPKSCISVAPLEDPCIQKERGPVPTGHFPGPQGLFRLS